MAINYNPTNWIKGTVLNPDNMNHFEQGIKAACDGVDAINETLPSKATDTELNDLKFLGWTVPREMPIKNYVDGRGRFHQRVGRKRMGDIGIGYDPNLTRFISNGAIADYKYMDFYTAKNAYWHGYTQNPAPITSDRVDKTYAFYTNNGLYIHDFSYTDAASFLSAHGNDYIYYELATEVVYAEGSEMLGQDRFITGTVRGTVPSNSNVDLFVMNTAKEPKVMLTSVNLALIPRTEATGGTIFRTNDGNIFVRVRNDYAETLNILCSYLIIL